MERYAIRAALHIAAVFGVYLSIAMLIPAAADLYVGHGDWQVFASSSFAMGGLSLAGALATQGSRPPASPRFGFLLVNTLWFTLATAGAVPFMASSLEMNLADAFFESVSAITTSGGTVIVGLDHLPPGLLLWRSLLSWMGGLGVIALGLFILPFLKIGGISYFRIESSDIQDRPFERLATFTVSFIGVYAALTFGCALLYAAGGMTVFNAVNHAMSTLATGGMSNHDASFGVYADRPVILWTGTVFMFVGALPFSILILFAIRGRFDALRDPQIKVFAGYTAFFSLAVAIYLRMTSGMPFLEALTHSSFNMVSIITTTGFASADYSQWGPFAVACAFVATFLGGCSGSTSGGIKAYRFLILFKMVTSGLRRLVFPSTVTSIHYGEIPIPDEMQRAAVLFMASFFILWAIGAVLLSATGLDLVTSMTGVLACLTNVGPGLGDIIGPVGNYSTIPDAAKWVLSLAMLLGRLEILAVLVIFTPVFWRG